jgi:hypothetical protein
MKNYTTVEDLYSAIKKRLAEPGYSESYADEDKFEDHVWRRLWKMFEPDDAASICLTSHTKRKGRSAKEWKTFCRQDSGADVLALGSNNRLDIVVKYPNAASVNRAHSIGIEVKCLGSSGHTGKLTQGLGQAMLALAHRDRTLMMIHCGTRSAGERKALQEIVEKITEGSRAAIIVVP